MLVNSDSRVAGLYSPVTVNSGLVVISPNVPTHESK